MSKSVLTLIAPPDKEKLSQAFAEKMGVALSREGALVMATDELAPDIAWDIVFTRMDPVIAEEIVRGLLFDAPIDVVSQQADTRQKRMLIADMDSTMITIECIDEIADFVGMKAEVSAITERAMRGELDFIAALEQRVLLLKGLPESALERVYEERVKFMPGARELLATMRAHGAYAMLVSGGFSFFTGRVAQELGFHADAANRLEIWDGQLTGKVGEPILDKDAKLRTLMKVSAARGISTSDVLAVGDGANDVPMLVAAGIGVAYHAKPVVRKSARARIDHCDLTALLYMQGYKAEEIVR